MQRPLERHLAANPVRRKLLADIEKTGGWDRVFERIENGETMISIATSFGVSRGFFSWVLGKDPARKERRAEARRRAAEALAEQAVDIVDAAEQTREGLMKAKLQSEARQWLASKYDRETFGAQADAPPVQVNIGTLHLDALRQHNKALPLPAVEVKELPDGESDTP